MYCGWREREKDRSLLFATFTFVSFVISCRIFNLIEDNSAAVYLEKSLVYFVQFLFECIHGSHMFEISANIAQPILLSQYITHSINSFSQLAVGLPVLFTVLHCDPYHYDYMYVLALYVYYMVSMHLMGLVDLRFTKNLADQKLINVRKFASVSGKHLVLVCRTQFK